jgi:hypothetical protein
VVPVFQKIKLNTLFRKKKLLRKIFRPEKAEKKMIDCKKLRNKKLLELYRTCNIVNLVNSKQLQWYARLNKIEERNNNFNGKTS